jgi:hypothetical protein
MISREDMLMPVRFLVPEVEAEAVEELSHVSRVESRGVEKTQPPRLFHM